MTPLLQQYQAIKRKYPDAVLLFRVGDFYEAFNEDAEALNRHTAVAAQRSAAGGEIRLVASLPHFHLDAALHKLVKAGHRVAICEELEAPKAGPMKRGVTNILKPPDPIR